ncbi:unnamed protein product [Mytilus coruscus]|uniref:Uncharacterized protein n=1 Tax=Mytilus coruscus TaxID=42192 RepID=A0A6J8ABS3_MYTCO|nr:unnamed protein product [Mytilus coruscus]
MQVDDEDDFMQSLGDFLSSEDKLGPKVSNSLAGIVNTENCEALAPVHVNLQIWKTLNRQTKNVDIMIQKNQGILCKGMVPQLTLMDKLLNLSKGNKGIEPSEVGEVLSLVKDSFVFTQMAYSDLNVKRRQLIKTNLRPCYRSLCPDNSPISDKLFGDSLVDKVKEVDIANRMGRKLGKLKSFLPATSTDNRKHRVNNNFNTGFTSNRFPAPYTIPENRFRFKSQNNSFRPSFSHTNDHFFREKTSHEEQLQEERQTLNPVDMECESFENASSQTDLKLHVFAFMNTPDNFIAGKIRKFLGCRKLLTQDNWILSLVKGYKIEFDTVPQQIKLPGTIKFNESEQSIINGEIENDTYLHCWDNIKDTCNLLDQCGFTIHPIKSVLHPCQEVIFLGFVINSITMTVKLKPEKAKTIVVMCKMFVKKWETTIREFAKLVGKLVASEPAVQYANFYVKPLEQKKDKALKINKGNYDAIMYLDCEIHKHLIWWINNIEKSSKPILTIEPSMILQSDSSKTGWGGLIKHPKIAMAKTDTNLFKPHSVRSASTSSAKKAGIFIDVIMKSADWKKESTFRKFYDKPIVDNNKNKGLSKKLLDNYLSHDQ